METIYKICHITSVHSLYDNRIFYKECKTLVNSGYDVSLIVPHKIDETIDGVKIKGIDKPKNRKERMIKTVKQIYYCALNCDADIYHFHDPEFILAALRLKSKGKTVIYDVHEDVPRQILSKQWLPVSLRKIISWMVEGIENCAVKRFDCIITATEYIAQRFSLLNNHVVAVKNYPILIDDILTKENISNQGQKICYISSHLSFQRAIIPIIKSMKYIDAELVLAGAMDESVSKIIKEIDGWSKTKYLGFVDKEKVHSIMNSSKVGLAIFSLEPNYINALPTKMFEYMREGLPVVVMDIPILREIIDKYECGLYINSLEPKDIAAAVNWLLNNPEKAIEMGKRGRRAVEIEYNWDTEAAKLIDAYRKII